MAKLIDKDVITNGRIIRVWNTMKKTFSNANKMYYAIWVEDSNGKNERCVLFTENEIKRAEYRASKNKEDLTKKSLLANMFD